MTLFDHGEPEPPHLTAAHFLVPVVVHTTTQRGRIFRSVVATSPITAGSVCVVLGGYVTPGPAFRRLDIIRQRQSIQVGDDLFLVGPEPDDDAEFINHSCEPSMGFAGEITQVALRDIRPGEALTFDYATCDSVPYDEFECECGATTCRLKVTGEDWLDPELQQRLNGHFSPYLQRRIDAICAQR